MIVHLRNPSLPGMRCGLPMWLALWSGNLEHVNCDRCLVARTGKRTRVLNPWRVTALADYRARVRKRDEWRAAMGLPPARSQGRRRAA